MNPVTKALYHDFKTIAYRPELRAITNSVTATILLQQVFFRWVNNDSKPFYKFKEPCNHKLYKLGDSWCEELGFSRAEFDTAWKALAATGIASKKTDMERLTYYTLNESAFDDAVNAVYSTPSKSDIPALHKETFQRYVKRHSSFCSYTEITPETTTEITSNSKESNASRVTTAVAAAGVFEQNERAMHHREFVPSDNYDGLLKQARSLQSITKTQQASLAFARVEKLKGILNNLRAHAIESVGSNDMEIPTCIWDIAMDELDKFGG